MLMKPLHVIVAVLILPTAAFTQSKPIAELAVHVAQANNQTEYAFVRARFEPGEVADPWNVRFSDAQGAEVPYFVWDYADWRTAREQAVRRRTSTVIERPSS